MPRVVGPDELVRQYDLKVRAIMDDVTLAREYKEQAANELYNEARQALHQQIEDERDELEATVRATRREAFAPPPLEGNRDKALLIMALDTHLERVEEIDTVRDLDVYLNRQLLIGNDVGTKACLIRAFELRASDMVARILSEHEDWEQSYMDFVRASEELENYNRSAGTLFGAGRLKSPKEFLA